MMESFRQRIVALIVQYTNFKFTFVYLTEFSCPFCLKHSRRKESVFPLKASNPGEVLGLMFAGYVPLASQSPYPIMVYFLANYRPHLSHFLKNVIFAIPT